LNLTIPGVHAEISLAALEAGKHVYSEKPFATSVEDGKKILALAELSDRGAWCTGGSLYRCRCGVSPIRWGMGRLSVHTLVSCQVSSVVHNLHLCLLGGNHGDGAHACIAAVKPLLCEKTRGSDLQTVTEIVESVNTVARIEPFSSVYSPEQTEFIQLM